MKRTNNIWRTFFQCPWEMWCGDGIQIYSVRTAELVFWVHLSCLGLIKSSDTFSNTLDPYSAPLSKWGKWWWCDRQQKRTDESDKKKSRWEELLHSVNLSTGHFVVTMKRESKQQESCWQKKSIHYIPFPHLTYSTPGSIWTPVTSFLQPNLMQPTKECDCVRLPHNVASRADAAGHSQRLIQHPVLRCNVTWKETVWKINVELVIIWPEEHKSSFIITVRGQNIMYL